MKTILLTRTPLALLVVACLLSVACESTPPAKRGQRGQRPLTAKEAAKLYVLSGNWSPVNGDGNQITFVPDTAGPATGRVIGIFSAVGTTRVSSPIPVSFRSSQAAQAATSAFRSGSVEMLGKRRNWRYSARRGSDMEGD
jgi:hypothetical protein